MRLRLLAKGVDMTARGKENREFVRPLYAESMDGHVDIAPIIRIAPQHEAHAEVGAGVLRSIRRRR